MWSRLCHQGTVYSASYAALPRLAELARRRDPSGFVEPLFLAASIVASTDVSAVEADVRADCAEAIRELRDVAERLVPVAGDDTDFVYRVQALIATGDGGVWMSLETSPPEVRAFDDASVGVTSTLAADPAKLMGSEGRAYELATAQGRLDLAQQMLEMFGEFECPICRIKTRASAGFA